MSKQVSKVLAVIALMLLVAACTREQPRPSAQPGPSAEEQLQRKFATLYRAARVIDSATAEGVNYVKFTDLLGTLSNEILIAHDLAGTEQEKALVAAYEDLLVAWKDSVAFWDRKRLAAESPIFGPLPYWGVGSELTAKAATYEVEVKQTSKGGIDWVVVTDSDPVQKVWKAAGAKSRKAVQLYLGPSATAASTTQ